MHRITLTLVVIFALAIELTAQSPTPASATAPAPARFEVASVRLNPNQSQGGPRRLTDFTLSVVRVQPGGRIESVGNSLQDLRCPNNG